MTNAQVTVTSLASPTTTTRGATDLYGVYCAFLPPGAYTMLISHEGMLPHRSNLDITLDTMLQEDPMFLEPAPPLRMPPPGTWILDRPHSSIRFIAKHLGMANIHGCFTRFEGYVRLVRPLAQSRIEVKIDASSIYTGSDTRDQHLRSADFLHVAEHPYISFFSDHFIHNGGSHWAIPGTLTLHGVTRNVALDTTYLGTVQGGYGDEFRCAASAKTELHRADFTLNWRKMLARGIGVVGPTIQMELDIQAIAPSPGIPTQRA